MKRPALAALLSASVTLAAAERAHAQAWLSDRSRTEGTGIRTGNLELHPGVGAELGYDSNYFQRAGEEAGARADAVLQDPNQLALFRATTAERERVVPTLRLRITPHIALSTLGPERSQIRSGRAAPPDLKFRANAALRYNEFFPVTDDGDRVRGQRNLSGDLGGQLDIKPYGHFGADLEGQYIRTVEPSNAFDTRRAFDRSTVIGGGGVSWRPGGGLFRWRLGYRLRATIFEDDNFSSLGNLHHSVTSQGRWLFLPRTALLSQSTLGFVRYGSQNNSENSGDFVRSLLGINGLVSYHWGFLALAGWGATFYEPENVPAENFDSVIGQAEVTWYPTPKTELPQDAANVGLSSVAAGYTRDFANSYFGDYYQRDRVYTRIGYLFGGGRFLLVAAGGYSLVTRPTIHFADQRNGGSLAGFNENRVDSSLFFEYRITDAIGFNATFRYDANLTHQQVPNGTQATEGVDDLGFSRYQLFLGARWFL